MLWSSKGDQKMLLGEEVVCAMGLENWTGLCRAEAIGRM